MAKKECGCCGKSVGWSERIKLQDGFVCDECFKKSGLNKLYGVAEECCSIEQVSKVLRGEMRAQKPTIYSFGFKKVYFNQSAGTWMTSFYIDGAHKLSDVVSYKYIEDEQVYSVGKVVGASAIGGMVFGGAGAIVGALIGGGSSKRKIREAKIIVTEQVDNTMHNIVIRLNNKNESPIKVVSNTYTFLMNVVRSICEEFDRVLEIKSNKNDNTTSDSSFSIADEIVKLKELYDQGILSEEEFAIGKEAILKRI